MMFPIGLQLYSVREDLAKDFKGTLKKVKEMGYDGVELAGLHGHSAQEVRDMISDAGLKAVSAHVPYVELTGDMEKTVADYALIGCEYVVIPHISIEHLAGHELYEEFLANVRKLGETVNHHGMTLLYHNHDFEFGKIDGTYIIDHLYSDVSADLLKTQLDTCWVNVGGENPAEFVRKYSGRTPVVHLKDFVMPGKKPAKMYELIGIDDVNEQEEEASAFEFRPVGYGAQNFPEILAAAKDSGANWVIVEQDYPSMGKTPIECAEMSISYLKSL